MVVQWAHDSAYRFFPLVEHADLGLTLHPFDLATSKVLALVGRVEPRDFVDILTCDREVQPLGCLAWAACGKDPGFSPSAILALAARSARYSEAELRGLDSRVPPRTRRASPGSGGPFSTRLGRSSRLCPQTKRGERCSRATGFPIAGSRPRSARPSSGERSGITKAASAARFLESCADLAALLDLARLFLKLGTLGFGGPAAHIALMEDEVVRRRGWLSRERFLDLLGATNLIPGPNSTEMAIHVGHERAGGRGLVVAGVCFIAPAFLIVLACAWAYTRYGTLPAAEGLLRGVKPVIIAIVLQALWGLGRTATRTRVLAAVGVLALAAVAAGVHELAVIFGAGVLAALVAWARLGIGRGRANGLLALPLGAAGLAATTAGIAPFGLTSLFLVFLKIGSVLFGSGYVLLAFLRADLVVRRGWLTEGQLLDAVAVGQVTPGPVFTTATFVGYVLGGFRGAVVATVGIFLPAFVFVALSGPLVPRIRRSPVAGAFLDGVNVASIALMALVTAQLARAAIVDPWTAGVAAVSAVLLLRFRASPAWLVPAAGLLGLVLPR